MSGREQQGIMLIELMIGLVIGLMTALAIVQVLSVAESQRRTVTSGTDAQVTGAVSLHSLQREIRQAGYGLLDNPNALGCPIAGKVGVNNVNITLAPVVITNGADGAPDSLQIFSSSKQGASVPLMVSNNHPQAATSFDVKSSFSAAVGDLLVAVPETGAAACALFSVTSTTQTKINHADLTAYSPAAGYPAKSFLVNLGGEINRRTYSISAKNVLQVQEYSAANPKDLYPEVVNLQALYGKDTNSDGVVDAYDTDTPTTSAGWKQVLAVRLAVVTRSSEYDKDLVTNSAPEWDLGTAITVAGTTDCTSGSGGQCLALKISQLADWKHYRYKVYDTLIPLRNALWNS